ncbi:MAG: polysaccharide deacetylase family protein [Flavobacteriales bacterium]
MLIYVEYITERLLYTLDFIFAERKISYEITNDGIHFMGAEGNKFNYSEREFENCLQLVPASILFEEGLFKGKVERAKFHQHDCLRFDGQTDPLASIFYILSRMEEYGSMHTDHFHRFEAKASVLSKNEWLKQPICEIWSLDLIAFLAQHWLISISPRPLRFSFQPTFDIDNTFAYAHKNTIRNTLANIKDIVYQRKSRRLDRQKVRKGLQPDPYDTFDWIEEIAKHFADTKVFWLLGNYSKLDKNLSHLNEAQQLKIKQIAKVAEIGLHGSSQTQNSAQQLQIELARLEKIIGYKPNSNRQHFLLLQLPQTYQILVQNGITHDYTLGYAETTGFRAGTARSFKWFDLTKNETTPLHVHPFVYMDGTLLEYMQLSPEQAIQEIERLYREVKNYGGVFSFLWHNETISGYQHWKSYQEVFKATLRLES